MKSAVTTFDDASKVALRVDSALWGAQMTRDSASGSGSGGPTPMEIGNVQAGGGGGNRRNSAQRQEDLRNNACFRWHVAGCRPWKHEKKAGPVITNLEIDAKESEEHSSNSEN